MEISVDVKTNRLMIRFAYDARVVDAVRSLPGRGFDKSQKCWYVSALHGEAGIAPLIRRGFTLTPRAAAYLGELTREEERIRLRLEAQSIVADDTLYPYQRAGAEFLRLRRNALLADSPGLGKTLQVIRAVNGDGKNGKIDLTSITWKRKGVLVLCPASLKYSWKQELEKWAPHDTVAVVDGDKHDRKVAWSAAAKWTIANYELLLHDYEQVSAEDWHVIVADEAQRISNPKAKSVGALKSLSSYKRIALTGTPISNAPDELWSIVDWLEPGFLGPFTVFLEQYTTVDHFGNVIGFRNLDALRAITAKLILRRTKEEVLTELPPKTIVTVPVKLHDWERHAYTKVRDELAADIRHLLGDGVDPKTLALLPVKMLRLKQATDSLKLLGDWEHGAKFEALMDVVLPAVAAGEQVIVFTQFATMANHIVAALRERQVATGAVVGDMSALERAADVQAFQEGRYKAMVMTEAGAYGLNLQAASVIVHYDLPWSVAKLEQREGRAHRLGQTKPVTVYELIASGTIDEYVSKTLRKKHRVANEVLGDADRLEAAGIGIEEIKEILRI